MYCSTCPPGHPPPEELTEFCYGVPGDDYNPARLSDDLVCVHGKSDETRLFGTTAAEAITWYLQNTVEPPPPAPATAPPPAPPPPVTVPYCGDGIVGDCKCLGQGKGEGNGSKYSCCSNDTFKFDPDCDYFPKNLWCQGGLVGGNVYRNGAISSMCQ